MRPARVLRITAMRLRGVMVTALVGASGTGKSFRARVLAEHRGISIIIDDGMLIRDSTILVGSWAKKERYFRAAVRRALFDDPVSAAEARAALRQARASSILIVGTSERMARRIAANLWLPPPREIVQISDVSEPRDISRAMNARRAEGRHAAPVPLVRVGASGIAGIVRRLARRFGRPPLRIEHSQVDSRGGVIVTEKALVQMASHCVSEYAPGAALVRLDATEAGGMYDLRIHLRVSPESDAGTLHALRDSLLHAVERHSGLVVRRVDLVVEEVAPVDSRPSSEADPDGPPAP